MSIWQMCEADYPGAVLSEHWSRETKREIYLAESHVGIVLSKNEHNHYDDSDFYAIIWDDETGAPKEIEYASTRGWSYPNSAIVDATDEVRAKYAAWQEAQREAARRLAAEREARTPRKGRCVRVIAGRKVAKGTEATVFWYGAAPAQRWGKIGGRVGLELPTGERVFVNAENVEVCA